MGYATRDQTPSKSSAVIFRHRHLTLPVRSWCINDRATRFRCAIEKVQLGEPHIFFFWGNYNSFIAESDIGGDRKYGAQNLGLQKWKPHLGAIKHQWQHYKQTNTIRESQHLFFFLACKEYFTRQWKYTHQMQPNRRLVSKSCKVSWKCATYCMYNGESVVQEAASQVARKYTRHLTHESQKRHREKKLTARYMLKRCMISQKSSTAEPPPTSSPCRGFNLRYLQLNATCAFDAVENCDTFLSEKSLWKTHWTCSLLATFCKNLVVKTFQRANFIPSRVILLQTIALYCFSCHYRVQCSRVGPVDPSSY